MLLYNELILKTRGDSQQRMVKEECVYSKLRGSRGPYRYRLNRGGGVLSQAEAAVFRLVIEKMNERERIRVWALRSVPFVRRTLCNRSAMRYDV